MFSRSVSDIAAKNANSSRPGPLGSYIPGRGPASILQDQAVGGQVVGERGEFGGVAAEPLHLIHGKDDPAVRGVGLDLAGGGERRLELRADPDAGTDLLAEDLLSRDAVLRERVQLGVEFLSEGRQRASSKSCSVELAAVVSSVALLIPWSLS
jgi:hypothetical protein